MKAHEILNAAVGHMSDRAATYDKPEGERSMSATVGAFLAVSGVSLTEEQGWLFMALLKAVRSQQGAYRADSYEDGAAYFALAGEAAHSARAMPANWGQQHTLEPAAEIDDTRADIVASSHGDGEHYVELEKLERWKGAPEWATHILAKDGMRLYAHKTNGGDFIDMETESEQRFVMRSKHPQGWQVVEARPCAADVTPMLCPDCTQEHCPCTSK
jgi:hypothetical protein